MYRKGLCYGARASESLYEGKMLGISFNCSDFIRLIFLLYDSFIISLYHNVLYK